MKIFLSWSGERSRKTATIVRKYLRIFIHRCDPWMSQLDIQKGARWSVEIGDKLDSFDVGIICVTPENTRSSWVNFEAGALSKQLDKSHVIPLLMGMHPIDLSGPLSQFQATIIEKEDIFRMLESLNSRLGKDGVDPDTLRNTFDRFWPDMKSALDTVAAQRIDGSQINIESVTEAFAKFGLPEPTIGNHVHFSSGFESHTVYSAATKLAKSRLWIWGRKNRKIFDKEYGQFFEGLPEKIRDGFDFRALFLDPDSPSTVVDVAHRDEDFPKQLAESIENARTIIRKTEVKAENIARKYIGLRHTGMVVVDDAILFTQIQYDASGYVLPLTKTPFAIIGSESPQGKDLVSSFLSCWEASRSIEEEGP